MELPAEFTRGGRAFITRPPTVHPMSTTCRAASIDGTQPYNRFERNWCRRPVDPSLKILSGSTTNLGRADENNTFAGLGVDRLTYGDERFPFTIRTVGTSGAPSTCSPIGANNVGRWQLAQDGDVRGSKLSVSGDIGSRGRAQPSTPRPVCIPLWRVPERCQPWLTLWPHVNYG